MAGRPGIRSGWRSFRFNVDLHLNMSGGESSGDPIWIVHGIPLYHAVAPRRDEHKATKTVSGHTSKPRRSGVCVSAGTDYCLRCANPRLARPRPPPRFRPRFAQFAARRADVPCMAAIAAFRAASSSRSVSTLVTRCSSAAILVSFSCTNRCSPWIAASATPPRPAIRSPCRHCQARIRP